MTSIKAIAVPARAIGVATAVEAEVSSLANGFLKRTRADLLRLGHMAERARRGEASVLQEIGRLTHSIHGTGAMFGYPGVSAAAGSIERWVGEATAKISATGAGIDDALLEPLSTFMQRLAQETDAAGQTIP
jgi:chemotaxis protein histidine kinase CheA